MKSFTCLCFTSSFPLQTSFVQKVGDNAGGVYSVGILANSSLSLFLRIVREVIEKKVKAWLLSCAVANHGTARKYMEIFFNFLWIRFQLAMSFSPLQYCMSRLVVYSTTVLYEPFGSFLHYSTV